MSELVAAMPSILRHAGEWVGTHIDIAPHGQVLDRHRAWTRLEFPYEDEFAMIQSNFLTWDNGRTCKRCFGGTFRNGLLHWDTDSFIGHGWETHSGSVMLRLDFKNEPGLHLIEMIHLSDDGQTRARTSQWFEHGAPTRRTLSDEVRVG